MVQIGFIQTKNLNQFSDFVMYFKKGSLTNNELKHTKNLSLILLTAFFMTARRQPG
jgi:hypothetical protein